jgi:uncharacterized protein (TIGR03067 family)
MDGCSYVGHLTHACWAIGLSLLLPACGHYSESSGEPAATATQEPNREPGRGARENARPCGDAQQLQGTWKVTSTLWQMGPGDMFYTFDGDEVIVRFSGGSERRCAYKLDTSRTAKKITWIMSAQERAESQNYVDAFFGEDVVYFLDGDELKLYPMHNLIAAHDEKNPLVPAVILTRAKAEKSKPSRYSTGKGTP